ncbi:outer membrane transport energization protein TonB [Chitinophaga niastensis]|uniref:Outer membrane transport energization protein TonB n=1 Tax=Chitinophaga niastensis TaxID=536980 RepID=A0A2P8HIS7_CHINA|nr:hypothetical protein [Chitinophaga niastensis]PSL46112.1 outer membrane transport energization protein TonB [Chitinophaga niastensis]
MEEKNGKKNIQALGVTIGVHALLLVALLFTGFSAPPPLPDQDLGMEVNLGTSDSGMGDIQPLNPNPPSAAAPEPAAAETPATAAKVNSEPQQDIATQDEEDAPEIKKPEKPVEKPKELPKKLEPKPVKPTKKTTEAPPKPAAPAPKPKAVFSGGTGNSANSGNGANGANNSTGEGNTGKPGDRGQIGGDPNAKGYTGGGLGGGRSDFHLNGRNLIGRPQVTYDGTETGYVAINIKVDQQGNVTSATFSMRGSTISNPQLIEIAKKAARSGQLKYNANPDAPEEQFGTVRFFFKAE